MKTTIKLDALQAIVVQPSADKIALMVDLTTGGIKMLTKTLTLDQARDLYLGLEDVLTVITPSFNDRNGGRCQNAYICKAGQQPCPSPWACSTSKGCES